MTEPKDGVSEMASKLADFKVHFGDASASGSERQPLRVCIAAQWGAGPDSSTRSEPEERVMAVNADNFDHVFERFGPSFAIELPDPVDPGAARIKAFLRWSKLGALRPNELVEAVPELSGFLEAHRVLERADSRAPRAELRANLERVLPRRHWVDAVLAPLDSLGAPPVTRSAPGEVATPQHQPAARREAATDASPDSLSPLFDLVAFGSDAPKAAAPDPAPERSAAASLVSRLAGITPARSPAQGSGIEAAREFVRRTFATLLTDLLEHPEVLRLEGLWRGLKILLGAGSRSKEAQLFVAWLDAGEDDQLEAVLAQDFDLLCLDREVDSSAHELDWLERTATLGAEYQTPILVNASPGLLGQTRFGALDSLQQKLLLADHPALNRLQLASAKGEARWVALVGNPLRIRGPHDVQSSRLKEMKFEQARTERAFVLMPPAFGLAALVVRSVAREGHPFAFVGPERGALSELEVHHLERADVAIATHDFVGTSAQDDAAEIGVALFAPVKNRAVAVLSSAPLLFRGEEASRGARPMARQHLSEALFLSRLTRVLRETKRRFQDLGDDAYGEKLRDALRDLFPNPAPPGPVIAVQVDGKRVKVTVDPRRYGTLSVPELSVEIAR